jgi:hypothetical protein
MKNELILAKKVRRTGPKARETLSSLLTRWKIDPALVRLLRARDLDPARADAP